MTSRTGNTIVRAQRIRRITWIGLATNLFLATLKMGVGWIGSSQAVIADAVHSLSDMLTDIAVLLGVNFWTAPADEDHPYGHGRIETLITVVIGSSLTLVAFGIGYRALATIRYVHIEQPGWIAIIGLIVSILLKEILYRISIRAGRQLGSSALVANAWHHRSDAVSSIPALIAVAAAAFDPRWAFIDHIGALIVALILLKVSWEIVKPALATLTDRGATHRERDRIQTIARAVTGVEQVHAIRTRRQGTGLYVDLHVQVDGDMTVRKGHDISGAVKAALITDGPDVLDVIVHMEPYD